MKPTAFLINTARGALIDEDALYDVLRADRIACAALDVREIEPARDTRFGELPNVVLSPHAAGSSPRAVNAAIHDAVLAVATYLRGERPHGILNPGVLAVEAQRGGFTYSVGDAGPHGPGHQQTVAWHLRLEWPWARPKCAWKVTTTSASCCAPDFALASALSTPRRRTPTRPFSVD